MQCIVCYEKEQEFYKLSEVEREKLDKKNGKNSDYYYCQHVDKSWYELERWNDKMCVMCADQLNCCRTCGEDLTDSDSTLSEDEDNK